MTKKKRKHFIKLNNKIRALFNGEPFDSAIKNFDDDMLYGLIMLFDGYNGSLDRNDIIKYIRRVWSEADFYTRKVIVDFLDDKFKLKKSQKRDKVELILSFLDETETTPQEDEYILSEFIDTKLSKITKDKVLKKLAYLRMNDILESFSKELDIEFAGNDTIEFIIKHESEIDGKEFKIALLCSIKLDISLNSLIKKEHKEAVEYLKGFKEKAKKLKEQEFEEFKKEILKSEYFNREEIYEILKSIKEPLNNLYHCSIPFKLVKKVLKSIDKKLAVSKNRLNFLISKEFTTPLFGVRLKYDIILDYEKRVLYGSIWTNNIKEDLSSIDIINEKAVIEFNLFVEELLEKLKESAKPLTFNSEYYEEFIIKFIAPIVESNRALKLKSKIARRVLYHFNEEIKEKKEQHKRQELLAKTIRDFKLLFPTARSLKREIIFNVGPTNSGKTYAALNKLKKADSGLYLAPLRLLALEGYEDLNANGVKCSLITGEEEIIDEDSMHVSSTIEMMNPDIEVEVCVIDEIQMIADRDRGWAWANALIGAPAKKVILTGSSDALEVVKEIAKYLNEPLMVVEFERKNPLKLLSKPTPLDKLEPNSAIVTFSRKEVLALKNRISPFFKVSVVYGNLSPEVRREEARRFREGESEVLIATDAIAMGLNLPIKTILFARDNKFDGLQRRELTTSEILQISGRAGRYGMHENGYVGAIDRPTLSTIKEKFNKNLKPIELPISVMASLDHVILIGEILQTENLYEILSFFAQNMEFEGPFVAANIDSMMEVAAIVDEYNLDLVSKYHLACAPVSVSSPYLEKVFHKILKFLEEGKTVPFNEPKNLPNRAISYNALLNAEDRVKEVSLYLWLSFKFKDKFPDIEIAKKSRDNLNRYIEKSLKEANFSKECKVCGKELDITYRFMICDSCYNRRKRGYKKRKEHKK